MTLDLSLSPETRALAEALREVPLGGTVTFQGLSAVIGRDVTKAARGNLESARRIVLRDHGAAFVSIRGQGYRRLRPDEAPDIGAGARRKIRRTANRTVRDMTNVAGASNGLEPEIQRRLSAEVATHGLLAQIASDGATLALEDDKPAPPAKAARQFLAHLGVSVERA